MDPHYLCFLVTSYAGKKKHKYESLIRLKKNFTLATKENEATLRARSCQRQPRRLAVEAQARDSRRTEEVV